MELPARWAAVTLEGVDARTRRSDLQAPRELVERRGAALGNELNRPFVVRVHHPADEAQCLGLALHPPPKPDTLHATGDTRREALVTHQSRRGARIGQRSMAASRASLGAAFSRSPSWIRSRRCAMCVSGSMPIRPA